MDEALTRVSRALREAGIFDLVFVGGATIGLYLSDPAAPQPRQTYDVDVVTSITTRNEYYQLELRLREAGYRQPVDDPVICRWLIGPDIVDIMPTSEQVLGFTNRWFDALHSNAVETILTTGEAIRVASPAYLLASKLDAYGSRMPRDIWMSKDLDDIVILVDGRKELVSEMRVAHSPVRKFNATAIRDLLDDPMFHEALAGRLFPDQASQARASVIRARMELLARLS